MPYELIHISETLNTEEQIVSFFSVLEKSLRNQCNFTTFVESKKVTVDLLA